MHSASILVGYLLTLVLSIVAILTAIVALAIGIIIPFLTSPPLTLKVLFCMANLLMWIVILCMSGSSASLASASTSSAATSTHRRLCVEGIR